MKRIIIYVYGGFFGVNMKFKTQIDKSNLNLSTEDTNKTIQKSLGYASSELKNTLMYNTPVDSGAAKGMWSINKSDRKHEIINSSYYLKWVNDGTGIYGKFKRPITPRRANVLVFNWKGKTWFLKSVKGQKPQKFVERSLDSTKDLLSSLCIKAAQETL